MDDICAISLGSIHISLVVSKYIRTTILLLQVNPSALCFVKPSASNFFGPKKKPLKRTNPGETINLDDKDDDNVNADPRDKVKRVINQETVDFSSSYNPSDEDSDHPMSSTETSTTPKNVKLPAGLLGLDGDSRH